MNSRTLHTLVLAGLDTLVIVLAYAVALDRGTPLAKPIADSAVEDLPYLAIFILTWYAAAIDQRLWNLRWTETWEHYIAAVARAACNATVFCVVAMALFTSMTLARDFLLQFCVYTLIALLAFRIVVRVAMWELRRRGVSAHRIVVIGANERTADLLKAIHASSRTGCEVLGVLDDDKDRWNQFGEDAAGYRGGVDRLEDLIRDEKVTDVYVSLPVRSHYHRIEEVAKRCEASGVTMHVTADFFPLRIASSRPMHLEDIPLLGLSTIPEAPFMLAFKRLFDFAVSTVLIIILLPVLFIPLAILIKLESRGPVFFAQERVGQNQRRFKMLKFRSMVANAEALRAELEAMNEADGPVFKIKKDPRITRVGGFIRKYSLDEFPQLFNVWVGQMSLVGPRPPIPSEVEEYSWDQRRRLSVKPGMTGLWQVSGRSDVGFEEWVELDLTYIDNWSFWHDINILLKTFGAVVKGRGAA